MCIESKTQPKTLILMQGTAGYLYFDGDCLWHEEKPKSTILLLVLFMPRCCHAW